MKQKILFIIFLLCAVQSNGKNIKSKMLDSLDFYIDNEKVFIDIKTKNIAEIESQIAANKNNNEQLYTLYDELFEQYKSFAYDSAFLYAQRLCNIAHNMNDECKIINAKIKICFCYLSSGLFTEGFEALKNLNTNNCGNDLKIAFYLAQSRLYYDMADFNNDDTRANLEKTGNKIISQALELLPKNSNQYYAALGLKEMKSGNYTQAIVAFEALINSENCTEHDFAIATSSLAYIYFLQNDIQKQKEFLIKAAIADIKSSTKETVALRNLAQFLANNEGDLTRAGRYIRKALGDARAYNARHRQLEIGNILPIIEEERVKILETQKIRVINFLIATSLLVIVIIIAFIIISNQLKKINDAKKIIQQNVDDLTKINANLVEANQIKEEYIGNFFNLNSEYVEKLEAFQRWVTRKVESRQYADLQKIPKKLDAKEEREKLFQMFDKTFLNIFPNFIVEFNKLLKDDSKIALQDSELLNNDLRIYALMRLGIKNNEKIAQFLNYSVNTIYTYKTKIKNRALDYDRFNEKLMEIKSI